MRSILAIAVLTVCLPVFTSCGTGSAVRARQDGLQLTEDEKHRLYSAALAASESPLDTDLFKDVCRKIGIFDAGGKPNNSYLAFVSTHVDWAMKPETELFKHEIDTKEKALEYIKRHMPQ